MDSRPRVAVGPIIAAGMTAAWAVVAMLPLGTAVAAQDLRNAGAPRSDRPALAVAPVALRTDGAAAQPAVTAEPGHGFVVTWQQVAGETASLHYATIDARGRETGRGVVASGPGRFINWADFPSLAVLDNGDWVTFWLRRFDSAPGAYEIQLLRSKNRGRSWSQGVVPHRDGTATQHGFVSLVPDGGDRVLVLWLDGRLAAAADPSAGAHEESAPMTLRATVVDRHGRTHSDALLDERTCSCCQTDAARWVGRTLVAYRDRSEQEVRDIAVVARGVDGAWSRPRILSPDAWRIEGCPVNGPAVAVAGERMLAIWPTLVGESLELRYTVRLWDRPGATHRLDAGGSVSGRVDAAAWRDGFLVSWLSKARDEPAVSVAWVSPEGEAGPAQRIAQPAAKGRAAGFPRLAALDGTAAVVWTAAVDGGAGTGIGMALLRDLR